MGSMSIAACLSHWARMKSNAPAVTDNVRSVSWHELDLRTNRLAHAYAERGVSKNDYVVITLPNSVDFYEAAVAAWKLGATPLPLSWRMPLFERSAVVDLVSPKLIAGVSEAEARGYASVPLGFEACSSLPDNAPGDQIAQYWKALASGGSTGRPKIIVSKDPAYFDPLMPFLGVSIEGTHLVAGPLYHNGPFIFSMRGLFCGSSIVVMPSFDAEQALLSIERHRVTFVVMVPTMMQRIWKLPESTRRGCDLSSLRTVLSTGSACPQWLKSAWIDWLGGDVIQEVYGGTEGCGSTWISGTEWLKKPGSVGRSLPGNRVRIMDVHGKELPPGEVGDIYMQPEGGPGSSYYYIGATPRRDPEGWETLGDMGYLDDDGYLFIADRRTDLIICGGANIYPAEVEAAIDAYPGIRSNVVIGLPDEELGARIHAIIDAPDGIDEDGLIAHLEQCLIRYKLPRSFEYVDAPVRDEAGKVRRAALRDERIPQARGAVGGGSRQQQWAAAGAPIKR